MWEKLWSQITGKDREISSMVGSPSTGYVICHEFLDVFDKNWNFVLTLVISLSIHYPPKAWYKNIKTLFYEYAR
jgi:hypothetical protein